MERGLLNYRQASEYLGISERKLSEMVKGGAIPVLRFDRLVRFNVESLREWIRDLERQAG